MKVLLIGLLVQASFQSSLPERVEISPASATLKVGESVNFSAKAFDADDSRMTGLETRWHIAASSIATIDQNGVVHGLSPGSAMVVAVMGGRPGYAEITVEKGGDAKLVVSVPVSSILSGTSVPIKIGFNGASPRGRIRFRSDNVTVATVDQSGWIHAKNPGFIHSDGSNGWRHGFHRPGGRRESCVFLPDCTKSVYRETRRCCAFSCSGIR